MAVREKDKGPAGAQAPPLAPGWWSRLDEFGQKHARLIVTVSAGLVLLTVLIITNIAYRKSEAERVSRDLARATTAEALRDLKERYAGSEHLALVLAALGHRLYADGRLKEAEAEYDEFLAKFADHPLAVAVERARASLADNLKFEAEQKDALLKIPMLDTHPLKDARLRDELARLRAEREKLLRITAPKPEEKEDLAVVEREIGRLLDSPVAYGPVKLPHPVLAFAVKDKEGKPKGTFRVELFEDEAPNTVAALVELAERKYWNGVGFLLVGGDERLQVKPKAEGPVDYAVPVEPTAREANVGSLVMIRQGANNLAAEFQLLLKSVEQPGDVTICGIIATDADRDFAKKIAADDAIDTVTVEKKREHEYKSRTVKP